jgi:hypothetical protein
LGVAAMLLSPDVEHAMVRVRQRWLAWSITRSTE